MSDKVRDAARVSGKRIRPAVDPDAARPRNVRKRISALEEQSAAFWLTNNVALLIIELPGQGYLLRGAITAGELLHTERYLVGPAMVRAYEMESKEAVYPRVPIDPIVLDIAKTYHAEHHSPEQETEFVHSFMTEDPTDRRFYYDYVSWSSVVENAGATEVLYGEYLATIGDLVGRGLAHARREVRRKYLWLHRQYIEAIDTLLATPPDSAFRAERIRAFASTPSNYHGLRAS